MSNLLTKCNADVYKAILEVKEQSPEIGESMFRILQKHTSSFDIVCDDMLWFCAHLSSKIWDSRVHTFHLLFESKQTTKMP